MYSAARPRYQRDDYLDVERVSRMKSEFVGGEILAMAGAHPRHNATAVNAIMALRARIGPPCTALSSDQRVTVLHTGDSFYPDVVVVCGEWALDEDGRGVTNPKLVVEVLSPSTRSYDRNEKVPQYKGVDGLDDVVLIDHHARTVEHHRRLDTGQWLSTELRADGQLELALGCTVPVAELFAGLDDLPPA